MATNTRRVNDTFPPRWSEPLHKDPNDTSNVENGSQIISRPEGGVDDNVIQGMYYTDVILDALNIVVCILGVLGNLILVIVTSSKRLRRHSYATYVSALCLADATVLLINVILGAKKVVSEVAFHGITAGTLCHVIALEHFSRCLSSWYIQLLSMDRLVSVCYPVMRNIICSVWKALVACCIVTFALFQVYILPGIIQLVTGNAPDASPADSSDCLAYHQWHTLVDAVLMGVLPSTLLCVEWPVIVQSVRTRKNKASIIAITNLCIAERIKAVNCACLSLLPLITMFLLCSSPFGLSAFVIFFFPAYRSVMKYLETLDLIGRGSHLFVFCCGSELFRRSVYSVFCSHRMRDDVEQTSRQIISSAPDLEAVRKTHRRQLRPSQLTFRGAATTHACGSKQPDHKLPEIKINCKPPRRSLKDLSPSKQLTPPISMLTIEYKARQFSHSISEDTEEPTSPTQVAVTYI